MRAMQVAINTTIPDVNEFLNHIVASTNMKCLTPPSALLGNCGFLAANLYAKSVFGEDALVNLSVEKGVDGKLSGYIRIRCRSYTDTHHLGPPLPYAHWAPHECTRSSPRESTWSTSAWRRAWTASCQAAFGSGALPAHMGTT